MGARPLASRHFVVRGQSMKPGLLDGDRLLVSPLGGGAGEPGRGDVVIADYDGGLDVKRVVGLPGERISVRAGRPCLPDGPLAETYEVWPDIDPEGDGGPWELGEDEYFLLGDNRAASRDSRHAGPAAGRQLVGLARLRFWPPGRLGKLRRGESLPTIDRRPVAGAQGPR